MALHRSTTVAAAFVLAAPCFSQAPTWKAQLGTVVDDWVYALAPDGAGGAFVGGATNGSLGAPSKGMADA